MFQYGSLTDGRIHGRQGCAINMNVRVISDKMKSLWVIWTFLYMVLYVSVPLDALHIKGTWPSSQFYKFLAKFGFQKTNLHDKEDTQGYIYGNITSKDNYTTDLTFVVVDSEYFLEFYGNRSTQPRTKACPAMFRKIDTVAWDSKCSSHNKNDFLRKLPCPQGELCVEEDDPSRVVPGYQFTYAVQDTNQPRFWYISIVSCYRNSTSPKACFWSYDEDQDILLDYDIWLVNGSPFKKHINPFEHQFSFELHDVFEVYLAFFVVYSFLVPIQMYALSQQKHMLPLVLTTCMTMEYVGVVFNFIHVLKYAFDGEGVELLKVTGNFIDNIAQCLFMLLLLLIVKGWTITRMDLTSRTKAVLFTIWVTYTVANMALFIWNLTEIDIISDIDEWQTVPGYLILTFRIAIMVWFLLELRETFVLERHEEKIRFYLHFGAGFLVWFVYLPIVAVICTQVSALWRHKTLLSVMYSADFLSYAVMVHLLWPSRSYLYFNLKVAAPSMGEDLEFTGLMLARDSSSQSHLSSKTNSSVEYFRSEDLESTSEESFDIQETMKLLKKKRKLSKKNGMANGIPKNQITSSDGRTKDQDNTPVETFEQDLLTGPLDVPPGVTLAHGVLPVTKLTGASGPQADLWDSGIESLANGEHFFEGPSSAVGLVTSQDLLDTSAVVVADIHSSPRHGAGFTAGRKNDS